MKSKIMVSVWLIAALLVATPGILNNVCAANSGKELSKEFKINVVQLRVVFSDGKQNESESNGFGFIVGEKSSMLYVVTAGHVVKTENPNDKIKRIVAQFFSAKGKVFEAKPREISEENRDLAVLEVQKPSPDFKWNPNVVSPESKVGDTVWFIGRNEDWYVPIGSGAGTLAQKDSLKNELTVNISTVQPGTSGAPLFNKTGIVGMVIQDKSRDEAVALQIETIKYIVEEKWGIPWNLKPRKPEVYLGIGTNKQLYTLENLKSYWEHVPNSGNVISVTEMKDDGRLLGIGTNYHLYTRKKLKNAEWEHVPNSGNVISVTEMKDGSLLGVGTNYHLYTRKKLKNAKWEHVPNSGNVIRIIEMKDGKLLGIGTNHHLYTRKKLKNAKWEHVPNSGNVISVTEMKDGSLLGVGTNYHLYTRKKLKNAKWEHVADSGNVIDITVHRPR